MKVLIVDDDTNVRNCLRQLIPWDKIGYSVIAEAKDGLCALQIFQELQPDVIITDLRMPGMDGETFCQKVRELSDRVSIIFLSAYEVFSTAQLALHCQVTDYILKPMDEEKLVQLERLLKSLSIKHLNSELLQDLLNNRSLCNEISANLKLRNHTYFENIFESLSQNTPFSFSTIKNTVVALLHLLFHVKKAEQGSDTSAEKEYEITISELNSLSRKMDIVLFTIECFEDYLHDDSNNKQRDFNLKTIERIKSYVTENIHDSQLSVASIADYFDLSATYLGRIFKKYTDTSLNSYITHIRINQACRLLKNTLLSVESIALEIGFSNSKYFCQVFKKALNITPLDYRNRH